MDDVRKKSGNISSSLEVRKVSNGYSSILPESVSEKIKKPFDSLKRCGSDHAFEDKILSLQYNYFPNE